MIGALVLFLVACGPAAAAPSSSSTAPAATPAAAAPESNGTLVVAFNADPETFDPHVTTALFATRAFALVYNNLIERDYDGSLNPDLAASWGR